MGTQSKGQLIFRESGSNKGILGIPLFAIFAKRCRIRDFMKFQLVKFPAEKVNVSMNRTVR